MLFIKLLQMKTNTSHLIPCAELSKWSKKVYVVAPNETLCHSNNSACQTRFPMMICRML